MFGYVVVNEPELRIREFHEYRSYYCGLCRALKKKYGIRGQMTLSYDMTFLAMLLSLLYEPRETECLDRCVLHPIRKQQIKSNKMIEYVADMNVLLTWYKCRDDFSDEGNIIKGIYGKSIEKKVKNIGLCYERQEKIVKECMNSLLMLEKMGDLDIDRLSGSFGHLLEEIFVVKQDEWEKYLRNIGFYIGKFIYIVDAYEDLEQDRRKGCFNPFLEKEKEEGFDEWVRQLLTMIAAEFAKTFEKLPITENVDILRNIIYSGIWTKYEEVKRKRMALEKKETSR
ncbi:MAG: hypothetical protein K2J90_12970 [Lachnospiraceae bacterium]|nr:hypothetical protein [Lachnospiraceae bacterium]